MHLTFKYQNTSKHSSWLRSYLLIKQKQTIFFVDQLKTFYIYMYTLQLILDALSSLVYRWATHHNILKALFSHKIAQFKRTKINSLELRFHILREPQLRSVWFNTRDWETIFCVFPYRFPVRGNIGKTLMLLVLRLHVEEGGLRYHRTSSWSKF